MLGSILGSDGFWETIVSTCRHTCKTCIAQVLAHCDIADVCNQCAIQSPEGLGVILDEQPPSLRRQA